MKGQNLLMIPGPIEFSSEVLLALAQPTTSHVADDFMDCFGECLEMMGEVFQAPDAHPFLLAGSGSLAMDAAAANLVEPGDNVLLVNTGYFGDRMGDILERYGAAVDQVRAPVGHAPDLDSVKGALQRKDYKIMSMTHVDTSTAVLADVGGLCRLAKEAGSITIVDGVAATGGAECRSQEWGADVYLTASQKAIGVPPGLALLTVSPRAMEVFENRKSPVANYYADFDNWQHIMQAYLERKSSYFGTPAVNLVYALNVSLKQLLAEGMEARWERHRRMGEAFRAGIKALGLNLVAASPEVYAPTLTAVYYPEGVGAELNGLIKEEGVIVAGGLHPEIRNQYFRVGHMGICTEADVLTTLGAIERALLKDGWDVALGSGIASAQEVFSGS